MLTLALPPRVGAAEPGAVPGVGGGGDDSAWHRPRTARGPGRAEGGCAERAQPSRAATAAAPAAVTERPGERPRPSRRPRAALSSLTRSNTRHRRHTQQ